MAIKINTSNLGKGMSAWNAKNGEYEKQEPISSEKSEQANREKPIKVNTSNLGKGMFAWNPQNGEYEKQELINTEKMDKEQYSWNLKKGEYEKQESENIGGGGGQGYSKWKWGIEEPVGQKQIYPSELHDSEISEDGQKYSKWKWGIGNPAGPKLSNSLELGDSEVSKNGQKYSKWKWNMEKPALPANKKTGIKKECKNKCKIIDGKYVCKKQCQEVSPFYVDQIKGGQKLGYLSELDDSEGSKNGQEYSKWKWEIHKPALHKLSNSLELDYPERKQSETKENEFDIVNKRGNLVKTFESWGPVYQIMFNIKVINLPWRRLNFLHFTTGKNCCEKGTRVPAVFLDRKPDSNRK